MSLHIYPQVGPHDEGVIVGTVADLTALRDALSAAIEHGGAKADVFASDGESYPLLVLVDEADETDPYYADELYRDDESRCYWWGLERLYSMARKLAKGEPTP